MRNPEQPMSTDTNAQKTFGTAVLIIVAVVLGVLLAQFLPADLFGWRGTSSNDAMAGDSADDTSQLWTCSMHPQVLQDDPGQCPICHMDLTPLRSDPSNGDPSHSSTAAHPDHSTAPSSPASWTCPDHSIIVEDAAGTCPIDGLELIPVVDKNSTASMDKSLPASLSVDPAMVQNMNVRTATVTHQDLTQPIRTVGYLEYDPQRMVTVTTKYSGWVEKVYVNYVGEKVRQGQPLFEIYSPELVQTEQELLSALSFAAEMDEAPQDARQRARSMVDSARLRLGYWDISPQQISRLEETGEVFRTLKVTSPADGLVMKRMAGLEGMAVQPGMEIFHLADLSSLWLSVELFEDQVAWVHEGTMADIDLPYFPGETLRGKVRFLEPEFSETTRTLRANIEVPNPDRRLRKGMYATVNLRPIRVEQAITVPTQAVLRTGQRNVVVLSLGEGRFAPREVTVGHEADGLTEILSGIEVGSEVVTSAQFLLDSESKLRQAVQRMIAERGDASMAMTSRPTPEVGPEAEMQQPTHDDLH